MGFALSLPAAPAAPSTDQDKRPSATEDALQLLSSFFPSLPSSSDGALDPRPPVFATATLTPPPVDLRAAIAASISPDAWGGGHADSDCERVFQDDTILLLESQPHIYGTLTFPEVVHLGAHFRANRAFQDFLDRNVPNPREDPSAFTFHVPGELGECGFARFRDALPPLLPPLAPAPPPSNAVATSLVMFVRSQCPSYAPVRPKPSGYRPGPPPYFPLFPKLQTLKHQELGNGSCHVVRRQNSTHEHRLSPFAHINHPFPLRQPLFYLGAAVADESRLITNRLFTDSPWQQGERDDKLGSRFPYFNYQMGYAGPPGGGPFEEAKRCFAYRPPASSTGLHLPFPKSGRGLAVGSTSLRVDPHFSPRVAPQSVDDWTPEERDLYVATDLQFIYNRLGRSTELARATGSPLFPTPVSLPGSSTSPISEPLTGSIHERLRLMTDINAANLDLIRAFLTIEDRKAGTATKLPLPTSSSSWRPLLAPMLLPAASSPLREDATDSSASLAVTTGITPQDAARERAEKDREDHEALLDQLESTRPHVLPSALEQPEAAYLDGELNTVVDALLSLQVLTQDQAVRIPFLLANADDALSVEDQEDQIFGGMKLDFSVEQQAQLAQRFAKVVMSKYMTRLKKHWPVWFQFVESHRGRSNYPGRLLQNVEAPIARAMWVSLFMDYCSGDLLYSGDQVTKCVSGVRALFWSTFPFQDDFFEEALHRRSKRANVLDGAEISKKLLARAQLFKDCVPPEFWPLARRMYWEENSWSVAQGCKDKATFYCATVLRELSGRVGNVAITDNNDHLLLACHMSFLVSPAPFTEPNDPINTLSGGGPLRDYLKRSGKGSSCVVNCIFGPNTTKTINSTTSQAAATIVQDPVKIRLDRSTVDSELTLECWIEFEINSGVRGEEPIGTVYHSSKFARKADIGKTCFLCDDGHYRSRFFIRDNELNAFVKTAAHEGLGIDPSSMSTKSLGRIYMYTHRRHFGMSDAEAVRYGGWAPGSTAPPNHYDRGAVLPSLSSRPTDPLASTRTTTEIKASASERKRAATQSSSSLPSSVDIKKRPFPVTGFADAAGGGRDGEGSEDEGGSSPLVFATPSTRGSSRLANAKKPKLHPCDKGLVPSDKVSMKQASPWDPALDKRDPAIPVLPSSSLLFAPSSLKNEWPNTLPMGRGCFLSFAQKACTKKGQAIGFFVGVPLALHYKSKETIDGTYMIRYSESHVLDCTQSVADGSCTMSLLNNRAGAVDANSNKKYTAGHNNCAISYDATVPSRVKIWIYTPRALSTVKSGGNIELTFSYYYQTMPPWRHLCTPHELFLWKLKGPRRTLGLLPPPGFDRDSPIPEGDPAPAPDSNTLAPTRDVDDEDEDSSDDDEA